MSFLGKQKNNPAAKVLTSVTNTASEELVFLTDKGKGVFHWITETIASTKNLVADWKATARVVCWALMTLIGLGLTCYAYTWLYPFLPKRRRGRYVAAVEMRQMRPSAPLIRQDSRPSFLDYYPDICCVSVVNSKQHKQVHVSVYVNEEPIRSLFDSGSGLTYARASVAQRLGLKLLPPPLLTARAANGTFIEFIGQTSVNMQFGDFSTDFTLLFSADHHCPADLVLGIDFLRNMKQPVTIDLQENKLRLPGTELEMINYIYHFDDEEQLAKVYVRETTILPPRSDNIIMGCINHHFPENMNLLVTPIEHQYETMLVGKTVVQPVRSHCVPLRLLNAGNAKIKIYGGSHVATLEPVFVCGEEELNEPTCNAHNPACECTLSVSSVQRTEIYVSPEVRWDENLPDPPVQTDNANFLLSKLDLTETCLSSQAQTTLRQIIIDYANAFVGADGIIGCYKGSFRHKIDLVDGAVPFQQKPYRVPLGLRDEVTRQIEQMLAQNIIRPSTSEFASPIILVKKKTGDWRFAVDYRKLNSITRREAMWLPNVTDILDTIGGKSLYSTMDVQAGFHNLKIYEPHISRTAFITFMGLFEFLRLPFGLASAPTSFQKVMDTIRKDLTCTILIYIDDLILASQDEISHLEDLKQLLGVLIKHGLRLKIDKCRFGQKEVKYLGFLISEKGLRPDPKNIEAVKGFKTPKTVTELKSFLGAVGYFRRFIKSFADIARPLHELTRDESLGQWRKEHQQAFEMLIEKLCSAPVLAPPRLGKPFQIETDASGYGISAVLLQKGPDNQLHPIFYASRLLNKHERNYATVEKEALAIVFALKTFQPYTEGAGQTLVKTDNSCCCSLLKSKNLTGRLLKYQIAVQGYDINIVHRPGKTNALCDHLSRYLPEGSATTDTAASTKPIDAIEFVEPVTLEMIRQEQKATTSYRKLYDALHGRLSAEIDNDATSPKEHENYAVRNGILYWKEQDGTNAVLKIIVPYSLRVPLLKVFHTDPLEGGHLGVAKTVAKISNRFYWPGLATDTQNYVKSCDSCQKRKTNKGDRQHEPVNPIPPSSYPMQKLHVDILGPLPETNNKMRYILMTICSFSKWLIASPMSDQTAASVCDAFLRDVICQHGTPEEVTTDNGRQLVGKTFDGITKMFGFRHTTTSSYRPQANGQIELENKTLASILACYVNKQGSNWQDYLPLAVFCYNSSVHATTKITPFEVLRLRRASLPTDVRLQTLAQSIYKTPDAYVADIHRAVSEVWQVVYQRLLNAKIIQKANADMMIRAQEHQFEPGQLVLIHREHVGRGESSKFNYRWDGPFTVLSVRRPNLVLLHPSENARPFTTHMDRCKPYRDQRPLPLRTKEPGNSLKLTLLDNENYRALHRDDLNSRPKNAGKPVFADPNVEQEAESGSENENGSDDTNHEHPPSKDDNGSHPHVQAGPLGR